MIVDNRKHEKGIRPAVKKLGFLYSPVLLKRCGLRIIKQEPVTFVPSYGMDDDSDDGDGDADSDDGDYLRSDTNFDENSDVYYDDDDDYYYYEDDGHNDNIIKQEPVTFVPSYGMDDDSDDGDGDADSDDGDYLRSDTNFDENSDVYYDDDDDYYYYEDDGHNDNVMNESYWDQG
ncbi:secreted acidic protein 2-like [Phalaenopsis equestris]|uniref:secreted acidic protein 2-like n=1 Tax=Phalaenopsis equestris TaxID=78828 RepID=UPI0009E2AC65|nr:secreted acidic protein 2-like [Phalaenopsis equestris]